MISMIFFIICAIAAVLCFAFSIYKTVELIKNPAEEVGFARYFKNELLLSLGFTVAFTAMLYFIYPWAKITPKVYESLQGLIGGAIFAFSLIASTNLFITYYFRRNIPEKLFKALFKIMMGGCTLTVICFFVMTNGYADYLKYPLVNGISLKEGFVKPGEDALLTFYALCILGGALFVYALANHKMKLEYGDSNIFESTFLIAFPAGIIAARIGYVVGNWHEFAGDFAQVFNIRNGGLTIVAGAVGGIAAGVLWFVLMKKKYSIWIAIDVAVPMILIAQAIGRWGNFFNTEVHGLQSAEENWLWLPRIIFNNAHYSRELGESAPGMIYVPLFYIECLTNLFGFGLLSHVFGKKLRKITELGDLGAGYIVWYGLTRVILEPFRDPAYTMGQKGYWSWAWSLVYVIVGCLLIVANHVVRYYIRKKKDLPINLNKKTFIRSLINSVILLSIAVALIVIGINYLNKGTFNDTQLAFNDYNIGLIFGDVGIATALMGGLAVFNVVTSLLAMEKVTNEQI